MSNKKQLFFDDLEVGMEFSPYIKELTRQDIQNYAEAVEDFNPLYLDESLAQKTKYKGVINHPTTAAILSVNAHKTGIPSPPGIIHAKQRYKFLSPTRPGEKLTTQAKIADKYEKRGLKFVVVQSITVNEQGEKKVESTATVIWPK